MSQSLSINEPGNTLQLLDNLNLAINEARLVRKIMDMSNQAESIESTCGPSIRTLRLREEVKTLENHLAIIRNQKSRTDDEQVLF